MLGLVFRLLLIRLELKLCAELKVTNAKCHFSEAIKIVFSKDWKETLHGTLEPGDEVRIEYDASRLPNRDTRYGKRAWNIFAEVQYSEEGRVHSVLLEGPDENDIMRTTLMIPENATTFIIWFKHHGYYNGYSYDSNFGENYIFPFTQILFTGDWDEYVKGSLQAGEKFQVVYDSKRLPWRDIGYLGENFMLTFFNKTEFVSGVVQSFLCSLFVRAVVNSKQGVSKLV